MFNLIRRFSGSVIPRPDRPWEEDPTSNAPHVGRKRRMADEDRDDDDDEQARLKKARATSDTLPDAPESSSTPLPQAKETADVKEVTQGVKEVELVEKPNALPESVPLPEEKDGELDDDASSTASTPPPVDAPVEAEDSNEPATADTEALTADTASEPAAADAKTAVEPSAATAAVAGPPPSVAAAPAPGARPIKKLPAKQQTVPVSPEPVAPTTS
ncbi:hypothetical protein B0H15DRAFT_831738 [Mycena belliarum]|uniref:Uncharacterized protein n=1 Tax=Mycena belliarum TaxID=1033014 RepID=A0AAD6UD68_9AGAR|nr:hypothetical protein B0H15DRAFT_831738 [Mycena belliae]